MKRWSRASMKRLASVAGLLLAAAAFCAPAQGDGTSRAIEQYREAVADSNPGELWEIRGEDLWKARRGPAQVSLESCDLGRGPGVVAGVYVGLPRFFPDAGRVMDLETRLLYCMVTLQGFTRDELLSRTFGDGERRSDFEALAAYIAAQSRGWKVDVPLGRPEEREAYRQGERIFLYRAGTHDFSCATCHGQSGKRIRLQDLPNLTDPADAMRAYTTWPAYRVSQGEMRTLQWRLNDCFRQQRFPELIFGSDASIALITYLAHNANGGVMAAPGVKR
jgi:sulfur-oxidizing protein SoxA